MNSNQTASDSLHPPVIAGASTGGESRGFFDRMKTNQIRNGNPYFKLESFCPRTMCWRPIKGVHQTKESAIQAKKDGARIMYFNGKKFEEVKV